MKKNYLKVNQNGGPLLARVVSSAQDLPGSRCSSLPRAAQDDDPTAGLRVGAGAGGRLSKVIWESVLYFRPAPLRPS